MDSFLVVSGFVAVATLAAAASVLLAIFIGLAVLRRDDVEDEMRRLTRRR